jgi:hypothetical protein
MQLTNFGEQFAGQVLKKVYSNAVAPAIVNKDYEGELKKTGDRVNILSFLNDALISDYTVGTDMVSETIVDTEDQLVVEKRKYFNFPLDRLEDLFTYGNNVVSNLLENRAAVLEREVDRYVLEKAAEAKAGSWIGYDLKVTGGAVTQASIVTTTTGGTVTLVGQVAVEASNLPGVEQGDGTIVNGGFEASDVGKGFRLRSSATYVSPWYRISGVTSSVSATITEWDGATTGSDFHEGYTLRGIFGGDGINFAKTQDQTPSGDGTIMLSVPTGDGLGWEIQAAVATSVSASSIYDQMTLLAEKLNQNEIPESDRHFTLPPVVKTGLIQAAETQPSGIETMYNGTVINGRVARISGFDIHMATDNRFSFRVGHSTGSGDFTVGSNGYLMLANHKGMITFADKWSESRVVDAENQFAKKYQGLYLYGAKVPSYSRKMGAVLFGNF